MPSPPRGFSDSQISISARVDPLLEGLADDCLYRHGPTGIVCAADARIDSAPDLTDTAADRAARSPAAVLARAYLTFGIDFLDSVLGDFAGVIWDPRRRHLLLFVDRVATRGIFYARSGATTQFSTDLRSFTAARTSKADFSRLVAWARDPSARALGGCEHVPGGHVAVIDSLSVTLHRYWHPADAPDIRFRKSEDYVDAAESLLEEAVRCRLPRRLKVGCQLSGGLDSPLIAGTAAKLLAKSGRTLTAITFSHTDPDIPAIWRGHYWDEHRLAAEFAARFPNIEHLQVSTDAPGLFDGQQSILAAAAELPLSALSTWAARYAAAARAQSCGIGAMLTGGLGNETVSQECGSALSCLLRRCRWISLLREGTSLRRSGVPVRKLLAWTFVPLLPATLQNNVLDWAGIPRPPQLTDLIPLSREVRGASGDADKSDAARHALRWPLPRQLIGQQFADFSTDGVYAWYRQGFGIDPRSPFLDSRVVEFCAGLPPEQFCGEGETRHLARRLLRRLGAPDALVNETRRGIQYANWHSAMMRERPALYNDIAALEENATASRLLDLAEMRQLVDTLPSANPVSRSDLMKYGNRLSAGLSLGRFVLHMEGSNAGPPLTETEGEGEDWHEARSRTIRN